MPRFILKSQRKAFSLSCDLIAVFRDRTKKADPLQVVPNIQGNIPPQRDMHYIRVQSEGQDTDTSELVSTASLSLHREEI